MKRNGKRKRHAMSERSTTTRRRVKKRWGKARGYQFTSVWLRVGWILRYSNDCTIRKSLQNKDKLKIASLLDG